MKKIVSLMIVFLAGVLFGQSIIASHLFKVLPLQSTLMSRSLDGKVSIMIDFGDGDLVTGSADANAESNVFDLLQNISKEKSIPVDYQMYDGIGVFIKKIGEYENGSDGKFWQYWVNNKYAEVSCDNYMLKKGDSVEWKFVKQQPVVQR